MKIDIDEIADKSKLILSEEEKALFQKNIDDILQAFSKISEVNTENIEKSLQPISYEKKLRKDVVKVSDINPFQKDDDQQNKFFKGPKLQ